MIDLTPSFLASSTTYVARSTLDVPSNSPEPWAASLGGYVKPQRPTVPTMARAVSAPCEEPTTSIFFFRAALSPTARQSPVASLDRAVRRLNAQAQGQHARDERRPEADGLDVLPVKSGNGFFAVATPGSTRSQLRAVLGIFVVEHLEDAVGILHGEHELLQIAGGIASVHRSELVAKVREGRLPVDLSLQGRLLFWREEKRSGLQVEPMVNFVGADHPALPSLSLSRSQRLTQALRLSRIASFPSPALTNLSHPFTPLRSLHSRLRAAWEAFGIPKIDNITQR